MEQNELYELSDSFGSVSTSLAVHEEKEDSVVDGVNILARATGKFFAVEEKSDNGRFYSRNLWEKAINEAKPRLANGTMLGTIGHDQPLDEKALLEGKASHKVSKLWIDEKGIGMGEILVLNTPAGRNLNGYLRGGVEFPISSRAFGKYKNEKRNGVQVVDEDSYKLEGFDFVRLQGIPGAVPRLVESQDNDDPKENINMSKEIIEKLTQEKLNIEKALGESLEVNEDTKGKLAVVNSKLDEMTRSFNEAMTNLKSVETENTELKKTVDKYKESGTSEQVAEALDKSVESIKAYAEYGSPEDIRKVFESALELEEKIRTYADFGSPSDIKKVFDITEQIASEFGTIEEIRTAFTNSEEYIEEMSQFGTADDLKKLIGIFEQYVAIGSVEKINQAFDMVEGLVDQVNEKRIEGEATKMAEEYKVKKSVAVKLLEKLTKEEATEIFTEFRNTMSEQVPDRFKMPADKVINESEIKPAHRASAMNSDPGSRAARLASNLGR